MYTQEMRNFFPKIQLSIWRFGFRPLNTLDAELWVPKVSRNNFGQGCRSNTDCLDLYADSQLKNTYEWIETTNNWENGQNNSKSVRPQPISDRN